MDEHDRLATPLLPVGQTQPVELQGLHRATLTARRITLQRPAQPLAAARSCRAVDESGSRLVDYLPVVRCPDTCEWPRRPPPGPLRGPARSADGVRRIRRRSASSCSPAVLRSLSVLGWTVRNITPRSSSATATSTFTKLGTWTTMASRSLPPATSVTSWPSWNVFMHRAYSLTVALAGRLTV